MRYQFKMFVWWSKVLEVFIMYLMYKSSYLTSSSPKCVVLFIAFCGTQDTHTFEKLPEPLVIFNAKHICNFYSAIWVLVAQWLERLVIDQQIAGSISVRDSDILYVGKTFKWSHKLTLLHSTGGTYVKL